MQNTTSKKAAPKKAVAKAAPKKAVVKAAPKKAVAKVAAKKAVAKVAAKKAVAKVAAKKAVAKVAPKKAVAKVAAKKAVAKVAAKKAVAKAAPKKAVAKAAPKKAVAKAAPKKAVAKVASKKVVEKIAEKVKHVEKPIKVKEKAIKEIQVKAPKLTKKSTPTRTVITSSNSTLPEKVDMFKTNTFGTSTLRNDHGKVIAHRKTADMKRKKEEEIYPKKYAPEEKRSLLDNTIIDTTPTFRYSDDDLIEFKEIIQRKLDTARTELQYLQSVIMRKDEAGTEDTENKYQSVEDGSLSMDREQFTQLASRQMSFISHLEQALVRIENKTYGICRETGKLIDRARLRAVPHATLSIEAKNAKSKKN
ncbi:TraR/DksA family transcriptional regulator [Candidatus Peregrinibacteria bacterium]|nr:TraR/DksA family transcriptional regulator [Candidatus Peregrinibacteria bacterium]